MYRFKLQHEEIEVDDKAQYMYSQKQVIEALLKLEGICEGRWTLVIQFGFAAITAGPDEDHMAPTAMIGVTGFGLERAVEATKGVIVDASSFSEVRKARKKLSTKATQVKMLPKEKPASRGKV